MVTSPCATCTDTATACPCTAFLAWEGAALPPEPTPCPTCLDAEWLQMSGELWEQVCARLRFSDAGLRRHLRRHGRDDLVPVGGWAR